MEFNESQKRAVRHCDGPMLLLAGPGSGKTTVITHRIKYMTEEHGVRPDNILVITFTKAAANEMKGRFQELCPGTRGVTFGTFHSVFFWMLRNAYNYTAANIVTDSEKYGAIRDSIDRHGFRYDSQEDFAKNVVGEIGNVKSGRVSLENYESTTMKLEDFRIVCDEYENFLRRCGKIDFDDMLVFTYELLSERPDILKLIAKQRQIFKGVSPNIDFYSGFVYDMLNIPRELYTPLFAIARIAGWSAHRLEELITTDKIIRPAYKSLVSKKEYIEREER